MTMKRIPSNDDPSKCSVSWLQINREGKTFVFGEDSLGEFIAIYKGDDQLARFETSQAELTGLLELWKRR
jgi:hypothetical protein